jgi:hypothetical protein
MTPQAEFSFCETVTASGSSPWHIRPLTPAGQKLGGGADSPALCGRVVGWDLVVPITEYRLKHCCKRCVELYQRGLGQQ